MRVLLLVPVLVAALWAPVALAQSCEQAVGKQRAQKMADDCRLVSPASRPPCHPANSCDMIVDEIKRGCAFLKADKPALCNQAAYR